MVMRSAVMASDACLQPHDRCERAPTRGRPSAGSWGNRWQTRRLNSLNSSYMLYLRLRLRLYSRTYALCSHRPMQCQRAVTSVELEPRGTSKASSPASSGVLQRCAGSGSKSGCTPGVALSGVRRRYGPRSETHRPIGPSRRSLRWSDLDFQRRQPAGRACQRRRAASCRGARAAG